jgi:hypothetical protein
LKKSLTIFVLIAYLFSSTEFNQFAKLPVLIQHYLVHKEYNPDMSLFAFIDMHYAHGDVKDEDQDQDRKLPFKSHEECSSLTTAFYTNRIPAIVIEKPVIHLSSSRIIPQDESIASAKRNSIWQPPRFC